MDAINALLHIDSPNVLHVQQTRAQISPGIKYTFNLSSFKGNISCFSDGNYKVEICAPNDYRPILEIYNNKLLMLFAHQDKIFGLYAQWAELIKKGKIHRPITLNVGQIWPIRRVAFEFRTAQVPSINTVNGHIIVDTNNEIYVLGEDFKLNLTLPRPSLFNTKNKEIWVYKSHNNPGHTYYINMAREKIYRCECEFISWASEDGYAYKKKGDDTFVEKYKG